MLRLPPKKIVKIIRTPETNAAKSSIQPG
jgi:hypothetical protein